MINMLMNTVGHLHSDVVGEFYSETECARDVAEMRHRVNAEGVNFLTKTLPRFGKAVDLALAKRTPLSIPGFKKKSGWEIPQFLWGLTSKVFSRDGCELPLGNAQSLRSLRQITYLFYKLGLPYDEAQNTQVIEAFVQTDKDLEKTDLKVLSSVDRHVLKTARQIICRVLCNCDPRSISPRHGPGVVATGEKPWQKPQFQVYPGAITEYYDYVENFLYNHSHLADRLDQILNLPTIERRPAKVVLVPKDSRGPRLISCEPVENQWIQQGQMRLLVDCIQQHPLTKGSVNFTDQTFNRWYAWLGSQSGDLVTLDMKEASDRVSLALVEELFPSEWVKALKASRSTHTMLPNGTLHKMVKFAPMGSAVCFPVESLIFYALCIAAIMCKHNCGFSQARRFTYVYGDDLIVSSEYHAACLQYLPKVGLLFNEDKCCTAGFFRESCGLDAYRGTDVTPTKIRSVWVTKSSRLAPDAYASWVSYSNDFYEAGYYKTAAYIEDCVREHYPRTPTFNKEGACIAFVRSDKYVRTSNRTTHGVKFRFNRKLHREEVLGYTLSGTSKLVPKRDWEEMLRIASESPVSDGICKDPKDPNASKWSCEGSFDSFISHLPEAGVYPIPHRNRLQLRWAPVP